MPLNTIFGIACAIVLVRHNFRGKAILNALIDLPFAVSPVVIGLSLVLVYGSVDGWFGPWLAEHGHPGDLLGRRGWRWRRSSSRCRSSSARWQPVLQEIGDEQEQAARDPGRIGLADLLAGHAAVDPLGRDLRGRAGDGASARRVRCRGRRLRARSRARPRPRPCCVEKQYEHFNVAGAYAAALVLAVMALATLLAMNLIQRRERKTRRAGQRGGSPASTPAALDNRKGDS